MPRRIDLQEEEVVENEEPKKETSSGLSGLFGGNFIFWIIIILVILFLFGGTGFGYGYSIEE